MQKMRVLLKNVRENKVEIHDSLGEAAERLKMTPGGVRNAISRKSVIKRYWIAKYATEEDFSEIPNSSEEPITEFVQDQGAHGYKNPLYKSPQPKPQEDLAPHEKAEVFKFGKDGQKIPVDI